VRAGIATRVTSASAIIPSGDLNSLISDDILNGEAAADGFKVAANGPDLRAFEVAVFDLGHLALSDADPLRKLGLRQACLLAQSQLCRPR
jgi:hypothetical protein